MDRIWSIVSVICAAFANKNIVHMTSYNSYSRCFVKWVEENSVKRRKILSAAAFRGRHRELSLAEGLKPDVLADTSLALVFGDQQTLREGSAINSNKSMLEVSNYGAKLPRWCKQ